MENEKTESMFYFVFPAERFTHVRGGHFCPDISIAKRDVQFYGTLTHTFFATSISFGQAKSGKLTTDLFELFCLENGMR